MSDEPHKKPAPAVSVPIQMSEETARGRYANLVALNHSPTEFVLDFLFVAPASPQPQGFAQSRILMHPVQAKRLAAALSQRVAMYEQRFGPIRTESPGPDDEPRFH